ncbi:hypothetical protein QQF64_015002 [Cirrhinus molitorella]|uniref:Uncharacterized protein n=1 Tax=Cirrhinus molitorella TaxID=172907 RepID=A0ABR3NU64_9TELE
MPLVGGDQYLYAITSGGDFRNCSSAVTPLTRDSETDRHCSLRILFSTEWVDTAFAEAKVLFPKGKWEGEENNNHL